ncbi:hypothetical protein M0R45_021728 [Rubus argutus]|uniref:Uncharacterized protein n=1 Tax=Rubus argutus TaxID=59490 RepID=A0AAW1XCC2_RUBAR
MSYRSSPSNEFQYFFAPAAPMPYRAPATTNSHHRPQHHVRFSNELEERVIEAPRRSHNVTEYVVQAEDVDDEAAAFIKFEHKKFQMRQMTMSDY